MIRQNRVKLGGFFFSVHCRIEKKKVKKKDKDKDKLFVTEKPMMIMIKI